MRLQTPIYVRIASRNLIQGGRRTALLGLALTMVTFLFVLLSGVAGGLQQNLLRIAVTMMCGHVNVGGFFKATAGMPVPVLSGAGAVREAIDEAAARGAFEVDYIVDRVRGWGRVVGERGSFLSVLTGVDISEDQALVEALSAIPDRQGRVGDVSELSAPGTLVIFQRAADRMDVGVGDTLTVATTTMRGTTNTIDLRVVAVVRNVGLFSGFMVFASKESIRTLNGQALDATGAIHLFLDDPDRAGEVMVQLRAALTEAGYPILEHVAQPYFMKMQSLREEPWTGQVLDLTTWEDEVSFLTQLVTGFQTMRGLLGGALLLVIVVGVMNTQLMSIRERTREIGTLRAIGMPRSRVVWMFLLEALLLGLGCTVLGSGLGVAVAWGVNAADLHVPIEAFQYVLMSDRLTLAIGLGDVAVAVAVVTGVCGLAALYPAWRGARMRPVTAIHSIG